MEYQDPYEASEELMDLFAEREEAYTCEVCVTAGRLSCVYAKGYRCAPDCTKQQCSDTCIAWWESHGYGKSCARETLLTADELQEPLDKPIEEWADDVLRGVSLHIWIVGVEGCTGQTPHNCVCRLYRPLWNQLYEEMINRGMAPDPRWITVPSDLDPLNIQPRGTYGPCTSMAPESDPEAFRALRLAEHHATEPDDTPSSVPRTLADEGDPTEPDDILF